MNSNWLSPKFLEGQRYVGSNFDIDSPRLSADEAMDFYSVHMDRALHGYTYNGHRMTGDQYWYLNFWPIRLNLPNPKGGKPISKMGYPLWCQADDYLFKQLEEADQAGKIAMLFTGRGFGKTYDVSSIFGRGYVTNPLYRGVLSAAVAKHVDNTWLYFKESLNTMEKWHPALRQRRKFNSNDLLQAGWTDYDDNGPIETERALIEKILYDKEAGKTRGRRLDGQLFEEGGDWNCPASLKECIMASLGSWRVGSIVKVRAFIIGTGGSVKSADAKELFLDPDTYSIYAVKHHDGRKTAIFYSTIDKCGGFYEKAGPVLDAETRAIIGHVSQDGIPDREGAEKWLKAERARLANDAVAQKQFIQEYPLTWVECFERSGAAWFNRTLLAAQHTALTVTRTIAPAERGIVRRNPATDQIEFISDPDGPVYLGERPPVDELGRPLAMNNAYIAGLDSIDQSKIDSASPNGSKLAMLIKKRQGPITQTGNLYVCGLIIRPDGPVEIAYALVLLLLEWYDCKVNLEYTKISIVPFMRSKGAFGRLIKRPKIFLSDKENEKYDNQLIGSPMDPWTKSYGINKLKSYFEQHSDKIRFIELLEQALDYEPERQTEFDWIVAMMMAEIADEEMADLLPEIVKPAEVWKKWGYYTNEYGQQVMGILPGQDAEAEMNGNLNVRKHELQKGKIYFIEKDGTPVMAQPMHQLVRDW